VRWNFDIVNADTNQSLPLDHVYNHHLVVFTQADPKFNSTAQNAAAAAAMKAAASNMVPVGSASEVGPRHRMPINARNECLKCG
jgi:hypothetical protein